MSEVNQIAILGLFWLEMGLMLLMLEMLMVVDLASCLVCWSSQCMLLLASSSGFGQRFLMPFMVDTMMVHWYLGLQDILSAQIKKKLINNLSYNLFTIVWHVGTTA